MSELSWSELSPKQQMYKLLLFEQDPIAFCADKYGLGIELWPTQSKIITDYYKPGINELILVAGMGGSKTSILCFLACIELKSLLIVDWTKRLDIFPHSPLFVTLASISEKQALDALWNCLTPLIQNSPLFRFYEAEIFADSIHFKRKPNVHLRLVSASSDTAVGRRNKFVGIDEMAKFEQTAGPRGGWQVYFSLKASIKTFKENGRMAVVGSPKHPSDVLMTLHKMAERQPTMLPVKLATWEMNPKITREDLKSEFDIDARAAMCNFGAEPFAGSDLYFPDTDIFEWHDNNLLEVMAQNIDFEHPPYDYVLAGDPAPVHLSKFGFALGHREEDKIIIDGATALSAELELSPLDIQKFILKIADKFALREATFDTWTFVETWEMLRAQGIQLENHIVNKQDYDNFKRLVYQGKVVLPKSSILNEELSTLITTGQKVDHPRRGSKDVADAVINCVRRLSTVTTPQLPFNVAVVF